MGDAEWGALLLADDPRRRRAALDGGLGVSFRWVRSVDELDALRSGGAPRLVVRVPAKEVVQEFSLADARRGVVPIVGTKYSVTLRDYYPEWTLARSQEKAQLAVVQIISPERRFHRAVISPQVELSQDMDDSGQMGGGLVDRRIRIELHGGLEPGVTLVGGPMGSFAMLAGSDGTVEAKAAPVGEEIAFFDGRMRLSILELSENSFEINKPAIIPRAERDLRAGPAYSMIGVELLAGAESSKIWVDYSPYTYPSRMGFNLRSLRLADGRQVEFLYSRESVLLPAPVALEEFRLETYPGGRRERDFISIVRFFEEGAWSAPHEVRSNHPTEYDGWWYFQSTWDPPSLEIGYAGMNATGLGVGNRRGVGIMFFGCLLTILGSLWAFYFKPWLIRRRRNAAAVASGGA